MGLSGDHSASRHVHGLRFGVECSKARGPNGQHGASTSNEAYVCNHQARNSVGNSPGHTMAVQGLITTEFGSSLEAAEILRVTSDKLRVVMQR